MTSNTHKTKVTLIAIVLAALALPPLTLLLPKPASFQGGGHEFYSTMLVTLLFSILYVGSAILFTIGLKDFKPQLKKAYFLICLALVLTGVNYLQYPLFNIMDLWQSAWFTEGGANALYLLSTILLFWGVKRFAAILDVKSMWTSLPILVVATATVGIAGYVAARLLHINLSPFDIDLAVEAMLCVPLLMAALLAWDIKQAVGPAYTEAMSSFSWALLVSALGGLVPVVFDIGSFPKSALLGLPPVIASILFINAAYVFNLISSYAGKKTEATASPVQVVLYLASLASNPRAVDPILDNLRAVTANLPSGEGLNEQDQASLAETYKQLETYLTQQESVQSFTKDSLRERVENKFTPNKTVNPTFWQHLG